MRVMIEYLAMTSIQSAEELAESYHKRGDNMKWQAESLLKSFKYAESVSSSIESIELNVKAIFLYLGLEYPKSHEFTDEQLLAVLKKVPEKLKHYDFVRLLLLTKFWSQFYTMAKYGSEKAKVGADKLFKRQEAELAYEHAKECSSFASLVRASRSL